MRVPLGSSSRTSHRHALHLAFPPPTHTRPFHTMRWHTHKCTRTYTHPLTAGSSNAAAVKLSSNVARPVQLVDDAVTFAVEQIGKHAHPGVRLGFTLGLCKVV